MITMKSISNLEGARGLAGGSKSSLRRDMKITSGTPKKRRWAWLLWWEIDQLELEKQVTQYDILSPVRSIRGQSVGCLIFSILITGSFVYFGVFDQSAYFDMSVMAVLAVFIYLGHRWALIAAMLLWTIEKLIGLTNGVTQGSNLLMQVIWWCMYMHAFYFAFRVEQERKKRNAMAVPSG
jgi:hypothetical protein